MHLDGLHENFKIRNTLSDKSKTMKTNALTLRQLRALSAVARTGSLTAAADELGLSIPAIHAQIKGLETAADCSLVQRSASNAGSDLTEQGRAVLHASRRIEAILSQCATEVGAISRGLTGRVTLGVVSTGKYFAPRLVKMLKELCPEIEIALRVGNRETIIAGLEQGWLDLAIMGRPPRHPPVHAVVLGVHPHGIVAPPDHPLAGRPGITVDDLFDELFLSREQGSGTRILMTRYLDRIGNGRIFEFLEMDSNETIKQATMAGLGVAFLSLHTVTDELQTGRLCLIGGPDLPINRHWFLVKTAEAPPRASVSRIYAHILALDGRYLPVLP